ncbi:hypothetical protein BDZ85DRAFT_73139 [Elsinoe ampelina]|uniref:Uncharacterized protein n=1 Tax=Elsinoe ampelina TaxID=302913 RepID=A0A6A6GJL9_9PEZI|nr:hypothetical protein BDZ85DRAFT_73139 [Elsinoe ampelina]
MSPPRRRESWLPFTEALEGQGHASRALRSTAFHGAIFNHLCLSFLTPFYHQLNPAARLLLSRQHLQCLQRHLHPNSPLPTPMRSRSPRQPRPNKRQSRSRRKRTRSKTSEESSTPYAPDSWTFTARSHLPGPAAAYSQRAKGIEHHHRPSKAVTDNAQQVDLETQPDPSSRGSPQDTQRPQYRDELSRCNP